MESAMTRTTSPRKARRAPLVFLFDVDNTLLDNDRVVADLSACLKHQLGIKLANCYWSLFEALRSELGYADYLGALQSLRRAFPRAPGLLAVSHFLVDYPFSKRLYSESLAVIARFKRWAPVVLLSDGDIVFQPRKVEASRLHKAVNGKVLIYVHKEHELSDVAARFPAEHFVVLDDKLELLAAIKGIWQSRVTTVFVSQGHYAKASKITAKCPLADLTVNHIADLLQLTRKTFLG
jgi:FMN phosphatase YigB (HAD superfamily)